MSMTRVHWHYTGIANPIGTWIHENQLFYSLPDELDDQYTTVVLPTVDGTRKTKQEAREYLLHKNSIRKIVESIHKCEQA